MPEKSRGVKRVSSMADMPDESIRCLAIGRHVGFGADDPILKPSRDWPGRNADDVKFTCDCGRWRRQTIDADTGEVLTTSADYGGGTLLWSKTTPSRDDARAEYYRRVKMRAARKRSTPAG